VEAGLAIWELFRGEDSEAARIGGVIIADMAVRIRYALGGKAPPAEEPDPEA
jgi:hypothetical protein